MWKRVRLQEWGRRGLRLRGLGSLWGLWEARLLLEVGPRRLQRGGLGGLRGLGMLWEGRL